MQGGGNREDKGRRARHRGDQPRPGADGGRRGFQARSLLPAKRGQDKDAAPERAQRGHSAPGEVLSQQDRL